MHPGESGQGAAERMPPCMGPDQRWIGSTRVRARHTSSIDSDRNTRCGRITCLTSHECCDAGHRHPFVLGVGLLLYGLLLDDRAGITGSVFILLGSVAWIALAIVFDQHRRERIEAVEFENFSEQDLASSSVFEESGADLRVAAKRPTGCTSTCSRPSASRWASP